MVALIHGATNEDLLELVRFRSSVGHNVIWAHCDSYYATDDVAVSAGEPLYRTNLRRLFDAAAAFNRTVEDEDKRVYVMPGLMPGGLWWGDNPPGGDSFWPMRWFYTQLFKDCANHPAMFKIDGKPVFSAWAYDNQHTGWTKPSRFKQYSQPQLDAIGFPEGSYHLWVHSYYPQKTGEDAILSQPSQDPATLAWMAQQRLEVDGFINFAVDFGNGLRDGETPEAGQIRKMVEANQRMAVLASAGKWVAFGASALYHSPSDHDIGFAGLHTVLSSILDTASNLPDRLPVGLCFATGNDFAELSYMYPIPGESVDGGEAWPEVRFPQNFYYGGNVRRPLQTHSGLAKFCSDYVKAFRTGKASLDSTPGRVTADVWHLPHTVDAGVDTSGADEGYDTREYENVPHWLNPDWSVWDKVRFAVRGAKQFVRVELFDQDVVIDSAYGEAIDGTFFGTLTLPKVTDRALQVRVSTRASETEDYEDCFTPPQLTLVQLSDNRWPANGNPVIYRLAEGYLPATPHPTPPELPEMLTTARVSWTQPDGYSPDITLVRVIHKNSEVGQLFIRPELSGNTVVFPDDLPQVSGLVGDFTVEIRNLVDNRQSEAKQVTFRADFRRPVLPVETIRVE